MSINPKFFKRYLALWLEDITDEPYEITDYDASFEVNLYDGYSVNHCELSIVNAGSTLRRAILFAARGEDDKGNKIPPKNIHLIAGYQNGDKDIIYGGRIAYAYTNKYAQDNVTKIVCMDLAPADKQFSHTFEKGAKGAEIINYIAHACGYGVGFVSPQLAKQNSPFQLNFVYNGGFADWMNRLCHDYRSPSKNKDLDREYQWFIYNGKVFFAETKDVIYGTLPLSWDEGLLSYPEIVQDSYGLSYSLSARTFLRAKTMPRCLVSVDPDIENLAVTGIPLFHDGNQSTEDIKKSQYLINRVIHQGHTRGNEWYTNAYGVKYA